MLSKYNPSLSVDCVTFGFDMKKLKVLLINQTNEHGQKSKLKLPGSLVVKREKLDEYALLTLKKLTGLNNVFLKQFQTFGDPDRISNPDDKKWIEDTYQVKIDRIISISYYSLIKIDQSNIRLGEEAYGARWYDLEDAKELAFDHHEIIKKALEVLQQELFYNPRICFELLPEKFSFREVQNIYEAIFGVEFDNRNFRKKIGKANYIIPTGDKQIGVAHKPAILYRFDKKLYDEKRFAPSRFVF